MAVGLGAKVQIIDINVERLAYLETLFGSRVELLYSTPAQIEALCTKCGFVDWCGAGSRSQSTYPGL